MKISINMKNLFLLLLLFACSISFSFGQVVSVTVGGVTKGINIGEIRTIRMAADSSSIILYGSPQQIIFASQKPSVIVGASCDALFTVTAVETVNGALTNVPLVVNRTLIGEVKANNAGNAVIVYKLPPAITVTTNQTVSAVLTLAGLCPGGGSGVADGNYGDISVSDDGTIWTINNGVVTSDKIAANSIDSTKIAAGAVRSSDIGAGQVWTANLGNNVVTNAKIASAAVTGSKIAQSGATLNQVLSWDGATWSPATVTGTVMDGDKGDIDVSGSGMIWTVDTNAITPVKINALAVTNAKIAPDAIDSTKIAARAVRSSDIGIGQVWSENIAANNIDSTKIAAGAVRSSDIGTGQVWTVNLGNNVVTTGKIATSAVTSVQIRDTTIVSGDIKDAAVIAAKLAAGAVSDSTKIAAGAVSTTDIADGAVFTNKLASNSVSTAKIQNLAVTNVKIANDAIDSTKVKPASIANSDLAGGITLSKLGQSGAATNQVPQWNGSAWVPATVSGGAVGLKLDNFRLQGIVQRIPALGFSANESVTNYLPASVNNVFYKFNTVPAGTSSTEYGGWLANGTSGDSISVNVPYCVIIGDSQAEGHPNEHGRLHPNGVPIFTPTYPDNYGTISLKLRYLTKMRWYNHGIGGQTSTQVWARWGRDVLAQNVNVGDGRGNQTLRSGSKPVAVVVFVGINDLYSGITTATTISNLENMAKSARDNGIAIAFANLPGDTIITNNQLKGIDTLNTYFASGALQNLGAAVFDYNTWWKGNSVWNDNAHRGQWITDDIHPTRAGYDTLATYIFNTVKLPVLDSVTVYNQIGPGSFTGFSRPTGITLDGKPYTIPNNPIGSFKINYGLSSDSVFIKITSSTNVSGTAYSGFSHILFKVANDTVGLSTRRSTFQGFQGSQTQFFQKSSNNISPVSITDRIVIGSASNTNSSQLMVQSPASSGNSMGSFRNAAGTTVLSILDNNRVVIGATSVGSYNLGVQGNCIMQSSGTNYTFFNGSTSEIYGPIPTTKWQSTNVNTGGSGRTDIQMVWNGTSFSINSQTGTPGADFAFRVANKINDYAFSVDLPNKRIGISTATLNCGVDFGAVSDGISIPRGNTATRATNGSGYNPIRWNTDTSAVEIQVSSGDWRKFILSGASGAFGNTNFLAKYSGGSTIVNSRIFDNGTNIGIGTASPNFPFEVIGRQTNIGILSSIGLNIGQSGNGYPTLGYNVKYQTSSNNYNYNITDPAYLVTMGSTGGNRIGFNVAPSGTANSSISFTELMSLTNSFRVGILNNAPLYTLDIVATDAVRIPTGTTAQRPTAAAGVIRHNTDLNKFEGSGAGATYYPFVQTLFSSTSNAVVSNTTAITSLASVSIPANSLAAGQTIRVNLEGFMSTLSPIPGKGRIGIVYGTDTIYTANDFLRAVTGNKTVIAEFTVRVSASGASGAVRAQGFLNQKTDTTDPQLFGGWFPITTPTTSNNTVDTTSTKTLSVFWQWTTADINNSISITNAVIKRE